MAGGVLGTILSKLSENYGDDLARNIVSNYGDDIAKRGANSFLSRAVEGKIDDIPTLISYHGIPAEKLKMAAKMDDYLVNPSIQTVNPKNNMGGDFGEIALLAKKDLVNSSRPGVSTFNRDVYSPRFPEITDDGMIAGTRQMAYPDSISRYMNKQGMKGVEGYMFDTHPGSVAGRKAKQFKNIRDMVENQQGLLPREDVRTALDQFKDEYSNGIEQLAKQYGDDFRAFDNGADDAKDILAGRRLWDGAPAHPQEAIDNMRAIGEKAKTLPTDYYETKVTRPVKLNEFSGAIVPHDFNDPQALAMLERNNIPIIRKYDRGAYNYDTSSNESLRQTLEDLAREDRFSTPYLLGLGGAAIPAAGILGSLFSGGNNDQSGML